MPLSSRYTPFSFIFSMVHLTGFGSSVICSSAVLKNLFIQYDYYLLPGSTFRGFGDSASIN